MKQREDRPLRVAMVGLRAPWGAEGGVESVVGELAPRLVKRGCEVTVYCRGRYNPLGGGVHRGVRLVDLDTIYTKHLEAIVHTAHALPRAILTADVVHLHATGPALLSWMPRLVGRATVVTVHGLDWQRPKWGPLARAALWVGAGAAAAFPHQLIVVGRHLQEHYRASYGVESAWIPNGVGEIARVPLSWSGVPGLKAGQYLLFVGRLVPEKRLELVLEAWRAAETGMPLVIVGGSGYTDDYARPLREAAPVGVHFTGPLYDEARDALIRHAAAFVHASRVEGFPVAPLEALAAGVPVLLSDIEPHREILDPDHGGSPARRGVPSERSAGWLVPDDGWVAALRAMAALSPEERAARGEQGRALVESRYCWDHLASQTLDLYREALRCARPRQ